MMVLVALIVPCGLLGLMMAMQRVQERLLPPAGPVGALLSGTVAAEPALAAVASTNDVPTSYGVVVDEPPTIPAGLIPAQPTYESSDSVVGSASLTSASPSR